MNNDSLWNLISETRVVVVSHYQAVFERFSAASGLENSIISILLAALTFEPDATSPARLLVQNPYTAADTFMARLWVAAEKGFMLEGAPGEFRLTAIGRARIEDLIREARAAMERVDPLPPSVGERLSALLHALVQSCLNAPPPPEPWSLRYSYKLMPPPHPSLPYIEQAISCLHSYRDDAHLAAWQKTGLSATALETLTCLWRNQAASLEALTQLLARRGYSPQVYSRAVDDLRERGFVTGSKKNLSLTSTGRTFREGVEEMTNRFFFAPWSAIDDAQREEMADLLEQLRSGLYAKET